jgi:hypothetical protein
MPFDHFDAGKQLYQTYFGGRDLVLDSRLMRTGRVTHPLLQAFNECLGDNALTEFGLLARE